MSNVDDHLKGSATRFWQLIEQRTAPGADIAAIDRRIWDLFGEEWAVMFTDLSGFSRHVAEFGIVHFLQVILEQKRLLTPVVQAHDGILIKIEADSFLILFKRVSRALECAFAMQRVCRETNVHRNPEDKILLCIGLGWGRLLKLGDDDVFGAEVNAASKLGEDLAQADEILITAAARAQLDEAVDVSFEALDAKVPGSERNFRVRYT